MTDADFDRAAQSVECARAQKRAQYGAELSGKGLQADQAAQQKSPVLPGVAAQCEGMLDLTMGGKGLEPLTPSV